MIHFDEVRFSYRANVVYSVAFSPDGNTIASSSRLGMLNIWRAPSWDEIDAVEAKEKAEFRSSQTTSDLVLKDRPQSSR